MTYLHKIDPANHPAANCPLCNDPNHDSLHLFNCPDIPTTLTVWDLWTDPVGVAALLDVWGEKLGGPRAGVWDPVRAHARDGVDTTTPPPTVAWGMKWREEKEEKKLSFYPLLQVRIIRNMRSQVQRMRWRLNLFPHRSLSIFWWLSKNNSGGKFMLTKDDNVRMDRCRKLLYKCCPQSTDCINEELD